MRIGFVTIGNDLVVKVGILDVQGTGEPHLSIAEDPPSVLTDVQVSFQVSFPMHPQRGVRRDGLPIQDDRIPVVGVGRTMDSRIVG